MEKFSKSDIYLKRVMYNNISICLFSWENNVFPTKVQGKIMSQGCIRLLCSTYRIWYTVVCTILAYINYKLLTFPIWKPTIEISTKMECKKIIQNIFSVPLIHITAILLQNNMILRKIYIEL